MGKKSSPQQPAAPDPNQLAQRDAEFNRIDQYTPFGSLVFSGDDRNQATLSFSPEVQQLFNSQLGIDQSLLNNAFGRLGGLNNQPIDMSQYGGIQQSAGLQQFSPEGLPEIPGDFNQLRQDQEDAYFQRGRRLLEPQFGRQEDRLRQTLANQGLFAGDEAAGDQFQQFGENRNRTYQDLADQAVLRGGRRGFQRTGQNLGYKGATVR